MLSATIEIAITIFVTLMLIAQLISIRLKIPYTLILVIMGIGVTILAAAAIGTNAISAFLQPPLQEIRNMYDFLLSSGLFVGLIVPPLIFEAMIHIRRRELGAVIRPSLVLATAGVLLSTIVAGFAVWKLEGLSLFGALIFAVIIAPTDTITVLQIFRRIRVPAMLSTMMDMEAAFNDATAIVLFSIIVSSAGLVSASVFNGVEVFLYSFIGGAAIGIAVAYLAQRIHAKVNDKLAETTLTIAAVYGSYVLSTSIGASGLIAVAIVGLYFGNSTLRKSVSKQVRWSIVSFWEIAAFVGNAVAFLFIGIETNLSLFMPAAVLILAAYASTLLARAVVVYPTFGVFRYLGTRLPWKWGNVATLGGVRGALSIALLATLASSKAVSEPEFSTIATMVLGVVFISIVLQTQVLSGYASRIFGKHKKAKELQ